MQDNKQKRSVAQWAELMDAYEASGQTQLEFTKENNVSVATFGYWRHKLRRQKPSATTKGPAVTFLELRATQAAGPAALTLCIGATSVTFSNLPEPQYLAAVLAGLAR